jgi:hypothetical protein
MTSSSYEKIAPLRPLQHRFPNPPRAPLHARPIQGYRLYGRFGNLGCKHEEFVHRNTVILPSQQLAVGVNANSTPTLTNVSRRAFVFKILSLAFHCFGLR